MDGEQEGERRHRLFSARELVHVAEALHRRHGVVLDTGQVGLLHRASVGPSAARSQGVHMGVVRTSVSSRLR